MALASSVPATQAVNAASASSRVAVGSRFSPGQRIDGLAAGPFVSFDGQWLPPGDQGSRTGQGGFVPYSPPSPPPPVTPLVFRTAAAFAAQDFLEALGAGGEPPLFLTDLQRGVHIYELNMRVIAGTRNNQGTVVNRFS